MACKLYFSYCQQEQKVTGPECVLMGQVHKCSARKQPYPNASKGACTQCDKIFTQNESQLMSVPYCSLYALWMRFVLVLNAETLSDLFVFLCLQTRVEGYKACMNDNCSLYVVWMRFVSVLYAQNFVLTCQWLTEIWLFNWTECWVNGTDWTALTDWTCWTDWTDSFQLLQ